MNDFWVTSLDEVIQDPISGSRPKGGVNNEGDIPSFGGENVTMQGGLNFYPVKKISLDFFHSMSRGHLNDGDVLINKDGANTGKSSIYRNSPYSRAAINEHLFILRGKNDTLEQVYLHYLLQLSSVRAIIETKITGSAQPGLNTSFVKNFPIELPPLPEQKKIAAILTSVDEVIESTQKQIDKLQDLKKATMNELLTKGIGHTEFKDSELGRIPKSWEVRALGDYVKLQGGNAFPSSSFSDFGVPVVRISNIVNGKVDMSKCIYFLESERFRNFIVGKGDILLAMSGATTGKVGIYSNDFPSYLNQRVGRFRVLNKSKVDTFFLRHLVQSSIFSEATLRDAIGGAQPNISSSQVESVYYSFPPLAEQDLIASTLGSLDQQVGIQRQKLSQTQSLKKSLMQDLLTGKVRVKVD